MIKFKLFIDMEQEEEYLNAMSKKGYMLIKYNSLGFYSFAKGTPQDLHYKIDYRVFKSKRDFENYIMLFQDAGWIHIFGTKNSGGQFFLPGKGNNNHEIFSDIESSVARYKRFINQCLLWFCVFLLYSISFLVMNDFSNLGYLTPGLWDRTGISFWLGFIFETPFVLFRILPIIIIMTLTIIYGYMAVKAKLIYKKVVSSHIKPN